MQATRERKIIQFHESMVGKTGAEVTKKKRELLKTAKNQRKQSLGKVESSSLSSGVCDLGRACSLQKRRTDEV